MSDLVARFRAAADQDAAFEAAMRLVQESTEEIAKLRLEVARLERQCAEYQLAHYAAHKAA